ncbi:MAG TPA: D-Ala-D-Ala carboxypeptidase family metallohydrolase [Sphingomicrobium sp.]|nr:D-Ala-D-Ala carboxypeptidase family metallohydrolase [Sphingomicrobium sp.]
MAFLAAPAAASDSSAAQPIGAPAPPLTVWNPASDYITAGQDEPGYRSWYIAAPWRAAQVGAFNAYLATYEVAGVVPTWQLLRTATSWHRCGGQPFEVPPTSEWPHIVQTLRYVRDHVVPAVGPVEPVSAYRNPVLNACAGGAPESAHKHYSAIDLVPLRPTTREQLMRTLCATQARRGLDYQVGLGFYAFLRFHVDTTKYRRWGADPSIASNCPPIARTAALASAAQQPQAPAAAQAHAATSGPKIVYAPAATSPEAPDPQPQR